MKRRTYLATAGLFAGGAVSGCLSPAGEDPPATTAATPPTARRTAEGVRATFRVVDGHEPTDETARATFEEARVVVTGSMDPGGCRRPVLADVGYDAPSGAVRLVVGAESPYGPTATVECGNASFDYRSAVAVERGRPTVVEVVHDHRGQDDRTFTLERG